MVYMVSTYTVMEHIVMVCIVMARRCELKVPRLCSYGPIAMARMVIAYIVMGYIVIAYIVMDYIVMVYIVMAHRCEFKIPHLFTT